MLDFCSRGYNYFLSHGRLILCSFLEKLFQKTHFLEPLQLTTVHCLNCGINMKNPKKLLFFAQYCSYERNACFLTEKIWSHYTRLSEADIAMRSSTVHSYIRWRRWFSYMAEMPYGKKPSLDVTKRHKHMLVCYTADIKPLVVATPAEKWGYLN